MQQKVQLKKLSNILNSRQEKICLNDFRAWKFIVDNSTYTKI